MTAVYNIMMIFEQFWSMVNNWSSFATNMIHYSFFDYSFHFSLWLLIKILLALPIGGILFRIRGGYLADVFFDKFWPYEYGATSSRIVCAIGMSSYVALVEYDWRFLGLWFPIYLGFVLGWYKAADIGRDGDRSAWLEFFIMTIRGLWLTGFTGLTLIVFGYGWYHLIAGLSLGLLYELSWRTPMINKNGFNTGMEIGEVYAGAMILSTIMLSVG